MNKLEKNIRSFIEDVFVEGTHIYDTENVAKILENTPKCKSKWCQTCNKK